MAHVPQANRWRGRDASRSRRSRGSHALESVGDIDTRAGQIATFGPAALGSEDDDLCCVATVSGWSSAVAKEGGQWLVKMLAEIATFDESFVSANL